MNRRPQIAASILDRLEGEGYLTDPRPDELEAMKAIIVEEIGAPLPRCAPPNGSYQVSTEDVRAVDAFLNAYPVLQPLVDICTHHFKETYGVPVSLSLWTDPETGAGDTHDLRELHVTGLIDIEGDEELERYRELDDEFTDWLIDQPWYPGSRNFRAALRIYPQGPRPRLYQMLLWHGGSVSSYIGYRNGVRGQGRDRAMEVRLKEQVEVERPDLPDSEWAMLADYFEVREDWLRSPEPCPSPVMRECWPDMKR